MSHYESRAQIEADWAESGREQEIGPLILRAQALREGGHTQRVHTVPTMGDASVGRHSFNMALLLYVLWPEAPRKLFLAFLLHDVAERWVGDTPAPAKYSIWPQLSAELHKAEELVEGALGITTALALSDEELAWLKGIDCLEFQLFCEDQLAMGNRNYELSLSNIKTMLRSDWVPDKVRTFSRYYRWSRTSDIVAGEIMNGLQAGIR